MVGVHGREDGPWIKSELKTGGISVQAIKGVYRAEEYSWADANARFDRDTKDKYSHDEVYGKWWNVNDYIDVPVEYAFDYISNVYSLEEWSYGFRDLKHIGGGIYKGHDKWAKDTEIFARSEPHKDAHAVDYHFAWDQKEELWIRQYIRLIDAKFALNRPGTIISWFSWKHPYFDKKATGLPAWLKDSQNKKGREWLGDYWRNFHAWHKIEADNLRYILEHRYHNKK